MSDVDVRGTALQYGIGWGGLTGVLTVALAVVVAFPLKLLGALMFALAAFIVPAIVGITDSGIETVAASTRIGFSAGDPNDYRAGHLPVPNALQVVCWLCGVGVVGLVTLVLTA
ncbi:hypothetical protein [Halobacterium zhouii]|uniref:hypothetical protein n=1 Tax=Halobacterium zhouii TaxID=2902624 RepID=UPI001E4112A5|nr:hypothetical protein [Halobacterium zhouii]